MALASFPGSGNTWVRGLLETATGICTGIQLPHIVFFFLFLISLSLSLSLSLSHVIIGNGDYT